MKHEYTGKFKVGDDVFYEGMPYTIMDINALGEYLIKRKDMYGELVYEYDTTEAELELFIDKNSMCHWYPLIKDIEGIPQPKTQICKFAYGELEFAVESGYMDDIYDKVYPILCEFGYPEKSVFIRTDHCSVKHDWSKTCFIPAGQKGGNGKIQAMVDVKRQLYTLLEGNILNDLNPTAIVVREYIPMKTRFTAFTGNLPIGHERRYFIRDGKVEAHFPYWIEAAISEWADNRRALKETYNELRELVALSPDNTESTCILPDYWKDALALMNTESPYEVALLTDHALKVAEKLEGYWSVDFCLSAAGTWYLIDCATGERSWRPDREDNA